MRQIYCMIQRKQSIWFFLAALITAITFFLPFGINQVSTLGISTITETDLNAKSPILLTILVSATTLFSLVILFLYKNRSLQMKLTWLNIILNLGINAYMYYITTLAGNKLAIGLVETQLYIGLLLPILSIFFLILAFNGVKSDDNLVKSTDRLR